MSVTAAMKTSSELRMHALAAIAFVAALAPGLSLQAQSLDNPDTVKAIVGSPVQEEQRAAAESQTKIIAAIGQASQSADMVRKTTEVDKIDIVFLADSTASQGGLPAAIAKAVETHKADLAELRNEVEGNAILYHAADSRHVLMRDIIAVEFKDPRNVVIYAAANPPG
jgi:hypothetical protein